MALRVAVVDWPRRSAAPATEKEAKANARLIAAAPDLFDACVEMIRHVNAGHVAAPVIDAMRAAVRKAGGTA